MRRLIASAAAAPVAYLLALLGAAAVGSRARRAPVAGAPPRLAVVVPAHDEETVIATAVASLAAAGSATTIVVADNCSDATAERARAAGATVWERDDPRNPGKGRALAYAFERIREELPQIDAIAVVDADCTASPNLLTALGDRIAAGARAVQASYVVANPEQSPAAAARYAGFALINHVRPLGKSALGLSCGLLGSGMAFTAELLGEHPWDAFAVTEDAEYHLRLVQAGVRVEFAPEAHVASPMPATLDAAATQRERWESGGFELARTEALRLAAQGVREGDASKANAGLELLVPPQSLLLAANVAALSLDRRIATAAITGQVAFVLGGLELVGAPRSVYRALALAPLLAMRNIGLYGRLAKGERARTWVRTTRPGGTGSAAPSAPGS